MVLSIAGALVSAFAVPRSRRAKSDPRSPDFISQPHQIHDIDSTHGDVNVGYKSCESFQTVADFLCVNLGSASYSRTSQRKLPELISFPQFSDTASCCGACQYHAPYENERGTGREPRCLSAPAIQRRRFGRHLDFWAFLLGIPVAERHRHSSLGLCTGRPPPSRREKPLKDCPSSSDS